MVETEWTLTSLDQELDNIMIMMSMIFLVMLEVILDYFLAGLCLDQQLVFLMSSLHIFNIGIVNN